MAETLHPGSWLGDAVEEFKKMPTAGKLAAGGLALGVVGIALYERHRATTQGATATTAADQSSASDTPGGTVDTSGYTSPPTITSTTPTPGPQGPAGPTGPTGPAGPTGPTGPVSKPTKPTVQTYTVQHGDSLSAIAAKLGLKGGWQALYNLNKGVIGSNPNLIYAGTKLNITGLR